jgi:hypothetical protein
MFAAVGNEAEAAFVSGAPDKTLVADGGNLSALASNSAICHISVSDKLLLNAGIPVRRIPLAMIQ